MQFQSIILVSKGDLEEKSLLGVLENSSSYRVASNNIKTVKVRTDKNSLGVDGISHIAHESAKKSHETKIIIIYNAEKLTPEAQNSLLKIVEEPFENTLIVFNTLNELALLETIRSRCIVIYHHLEEKTNFAFQDFFNLNYEERGVAIEKILNEDNHREIATKLIEESLKNVLKSAAKTSNIDIFKKLLFGLKRGVNTKLALETLNILLEN